MKRHLIKLIAACGVMSLPCSFALAAPAAHPHAAPEATTNYLQLSYNLEHHTNLSPQAVASAFAGYQWALTHTNVKHKDIMTIVDFSVSSAQNRMYVINMKSGEILMALPVAHGKGSGRGPFAKAFSNKNSSLESSVGVFLTENTYFGKHGLSLRIKGLETSNNNVEARAVVVHSANYASPSFIKQHGYAGNSWGCFAVDPQQSKKLITEIEGGSVLYAYGKSSSYMAFSHIFHHSGDA